MPRQHSKPPANSPDLRAPAPPSGDDGASVTRRRLLQGLGGAALTLGACGTAPDEQPKSGSGSGSGGAGGSGGGSDGAGGTPAESCGGDGGLSPEELLSGIDHIVVLCMENRSFDHYFGSLRLHEGRDVNGLTGEEFNPDPEGNKVRVFKMNNFTPADPPHHWDEVHLQWDNGKNDGFVLAQAAKHPQNLQEVMGYHVRDQVPIAYALADAFANCEAWYASVLGPTWPNRFYLHGGTSNGQKGNFFAGSFRSVFDMLKDAGVTNRNYYSDVPWALAAYQKDSGNTEIEEFFSACASGDLPQFSIIDPNFGIADPGGGNDDHPDHNIQLGQALIASVYKAIQKSPAWNKTLLLITYDEHGGFYDHVPPPQVPDEREEFRQLGFRVPALVIGPHVRRGCLMRQTFEHCSVLATVCKKWGLEPPNERVAAAQDLSVCIDPALLHAPQPGPDLPPFDVSLSRFYGFSRHTDHHDELFALLESGRLPRRYAVRAREGRAITRRVLDIGARLGAVRLVP